MPKPKPYAYCHLSNGDYDRTVDRFDNLGAIINFEMRKGGQDYIIITRRKLSSDEYVRICEIIEGKNK